MKTCSYCGKQYPNDATVCTIDGGALRHSLEEWHHVTGIWRGIYGYGAKQVQEGLVPASFTLRLKQGWMGHFTGSVTEDEPHGTPGTGVIEGWFKHPDIEFTKQMPVAYTTKPDGIRKTLREYYSSEGHSCDQELPGARIAYKGSFLDANRVQGIWTIKPARIVLPDGYAFSWRRNSGYWCAEFIAADTAANPTGGPTAPLFDKSLLTIQELGLVECGPLVRLGKFSVPDAERLIRRFEEEKILYDIGREEISPLQSSSWPGISDGRGMRRIISLYVHPQDRARADAILLEDMPV